MAESVNLYAPPKAKVEDVTPYDGAAEEIRREHIKTEASIRSIGVLYYIGATVCCIASIGFLIGSARVPSGLPLSMKALGALYLLFGVLGFFVARGIRKLRPWARITAIVLAAIGLLGFPVGTLINGYILYLLLSGKGKRIFESDYADVVAATPDIKYKTSIVTWIAVIVLLLVVVGVIAAIIIPRYH